MALGAATIWEVQTGGNDTNNGGAFDPGQTAGMFTDGSAGSGNTATPTFWSPSYNFVAGDAGAWVYIASGTATSSWAAGWYNITAVNTNTATLNGTIGQGILKTILAPTTVVGVATTTSPTGATWTIDYSQGTAAQFTYTDLASTGAGLTCTSSAKPFAKQQVGNSIVITGTGTNFNLGRYVIASISGVTATVVGPTNIASGVATAGTGGQGGALASPGQSSANLVSGNAVFVKSGTYTITSATQQIAGGTVKLNAAGGHLYFIGYTTYRTDAGRPTLILNAGVTSATIITAVCYPVIKNFILDGANVATSSGYSGNAGNGGGTIMNVKVQNCTTNVFNTGNVAHNVIKCQATGNSVTSFIIGNGIYIGCEAYSNTAHGFQLSVNVALYCLSYNNTGAGSDGFSLAGGIAMNCIAYGNGRDGFRLGNDTACVNCHSEANGVTSAAGKGYVVSRPSNAFINCTEFNNPGGTITAPSAYATLQAITVLTSSAFVNAAGSNFALNNTAGGGASCRAAGIPGTFPTGTTIGYQDIGAAQHADPVTAAAIYPIMD